MGKQREGDTIFDLKVSGGKNLRGNDAYRTWKTTLQWAALTSRASIILLQYVFQFQNKAARLNGLER